MNAQWETAERVADFGLDEESETLIWAWQSQVLSTFWRIMSFSSHPSAVPPIVHEVLRSPGQPLDAGTRAFTELRFGHDFSAVPAHIDAKAAESAQVE